MSAQLRVATSDDAEFAIRVERETMQAYAIETWGVWQDAESRERAIANVLAGRTQVIELERAPIGILRVERTDSSIDLKQIFILPEYQRRGLGSALLHQLMR